MGSGCSGFHPKFYAWQLKKELALMNYLSGNLNPLLALILPKIWEIDFCDCLASDLGWMGADLDDAIDVDWHLVQASGFKVLSFGFRVSGFGFRVSGFGFWVSGFGFRVSEFWFRVSGSGFRVPGSGFRVPGSGFRVSVFGFRVSVFWFRILGFGFTSFAASYDFPRACLGFKFRVSSLGMRD